MLNSSTENLNLILESGKNSTWKEGIGYNKQKGVNEERSED